MSKFALILVLFLWISAYAKAQITTSPQFPVVAKEVILTFDSRLDNRLNYFTSDLYAHTGILVEGNTLWQNVIGQWGQNNIQPKLTHLGDGIYQLKISPDIRSFYSITSNQKVQKLAFVFRSSDGSKQTNDLFVNVFADGLALELKGSFEGEIYDQGQAYTWTASTSVAADLQLFFQGQLLATHSGTSVTTQKTFNSTVEGWMVAVATTNNQVVKDSVFVFVREQTVVAPLPSAARKGISYPSDHSARLVLWAPKKSFVFVIGDFNNWKPSNQYQMKRQGDYFWIDLTGLEKGKPYLFQYYIDGKIKVADAYTEQISDPWHDHQIKAETYPGLPRFPEGKTTGIASVLQPGLEPYQWEITNFVMPPVEKMVIYEMLIRDFTLEHTYESILSRLDYLQDLRVNVLELMPVNEFEANSSWGYNPSFFFAPDKYYGHRDKLKKLIDECHKRGIAVVIDMVLNHSYGQSPFVQMYMDNWTITPDNPWYNVKSNFQNQSLTWGYDFNHDSQATRELVDSINSFWMSEYKIDGFRFDFTKGFSNTPYGPSSWGSSYDAARVANLKRMADEIWKRKPGTLVILEHLADNDEEKALADYGMLLWGNMNHAYRDAARGAQSDFSWGIHTRRNWRQPNLISYMESHDEERVIYTAKTSGLASGNYNVRDLNTALARAELNAVFFIPLPGPKMIWQFGELGYDISIDQNGRTGEKPVKWDYTQNANRAKLFKVKASLNHLKQTYEEFQPDLMEYSLNGTIKWYRLKAGNNYVYAIGNFGLTEQSTTVRFPVSGTWHSYFDNSTIQASSTDMTINLLPGEYKLFSTRAFSVPDIRVSAAVAESPKKQVRFYPNPASGQLFIASDHISRIEVLSLAGQVMHMSQFQQSVNQTTIDVSYFMSGVYFVKVKDIFNTEKIFKFVKQ